MSLDGVDAFSDIPVGTPVVIEDYGQERFIVNQTLSGGMGRVFQLLPLRPQLTACALKTLQVHADLNAFNRECEIWLTVSDHPFIARAHWYGRWRHVPAVLADWYETPLANIDLSCRDSEYILRFFGSTIAALQYAARVHNVIHQDIKPTNILVDMHGHPRLADFGISRIVSGSEHRINLTTARGTAYQTISTGPCPGTPAYMAPELLLQQAGPSVRTDIYSLGITICESLFRQHPYLGPDTGYTLCPSLRSVVRSRLESLSRSPLGVLATLVKQAISWDWHRRPSSYDALPPLPAFCTSHEVGTAATHPVTHAIGITRLYRKQRRFSKAHSVLEKALQSAPHNPALLNALALLFQAEGKTTAMARTLEKAVSTLFTAAETTTHSICVDPAVNLARFYILSGRFRRAVNLLEQTWNLLGRLEGSATKHSELLFSEFAWMMLYNHQFKECCSHVIAYERYRTGDGECVKWLTLASWCTGSPELYVTPIQAVIAHLDKQDYGVALCIVLTAALLTDADREELLSLLQKHCVLFLEGLENRHGLCRGALRPPVGETTIHLALAQLDLEVTGGNCNGSV